jgi:hypothetical protein
MIGKNERLLRIRKAPKFVPGNPHVATVWRWILHGVRGHKLESILVGGQRFTSVEAIERFIAATTATANGEPAPIRSPQQRERAAERAGRELTKLGVGRTS